MAIINDVTEVLHKIEAKLYPNYLGKGEGTYVARAKAETTLSIEDVCAAAKNRGGFTGSYQDLVEHVEIFLNEMIYQLLDGFSVQLGVFFSLHTKIGGTYISEKDRIAAENLHVSFRTLGYLRELLLKVKIENEGLAGDGAYIDEIIDVALDSVNGTLSAGGIFTLNGHKIKIAGAHNDCGVWFESVDDPSKRIKANDRFAENTSSKIIGVTPLLTKGLWRVQVETQYAGGTLLKEPRIIKLEKNLSVA
ncbi:MAG: DUF4469 domain-containing protein [Spirochaetaceae bacterium]|jgi:hypothetical protein|nr:DUF4469 domain-containing protein [Spirochaetaceae bacterium]